MSKHNSVVTPLLIQANNLHKNILKYIYPCPLTIELGDGKVVMKSDEFLQFKYIPFFFAIIVIVYHLGLFVNMFPPVLKFFNREANVNIFTIFFCLLCTSVISTHLGICFTFSKTREIETLFNQIHTFEINCKLVNKFLTKLKFELTDFLSCGLANF